MQTNVLSVENIRERALYLSALLLSLFLVQASKPAAFNPISVSVPSGPVRRRGGGGGSSDSVSFAVELLIMVAVIPVAITAWLAVDSAGWGTGPIALWNLGPILIIVVMIYMVYYRVKHR